MIYGGTTDGLTFRCARIGAGPFQKCSWILLRWRRRKASLRVREISFFFGMIVGMSTASLNAAEQESNLAGTAGAQFDSVSLLFEAEDFQFPGGWGVMGGENTASQGKYLFVGHADRKPVHDAQTVVHIPRAARYHVWTRGKDFARLSQGTRRFTIAIDGVPFSAEAGTHGGDGFAWEKMGDRELAAGEHLLGIRDTVGNFGRCDAVLLTTADRDLRALSLDAAGAYRVRPVPAKVQRRIGAQPQAAGGPREKIAEISNERIRIQFFQTQDTTGRPVVVREHELKLHGAWERLPSLGATESLFVLFAPKVEVSFNDYPRWSDGGGMSLTVAGKVIDTIAGVVDPFAAAPLEYLTGRGARQEGNSVLVEYETGSALKAIGRWSLAPGGCDTRLDLTLRPVRSGFYSVGMAAFLPFAREEIESVQLPMLYQMQRLPRQPCLMVSAMTPHPLVLIQGKPAGYGDRSVSFGAVAEPSELPFRWATWRNSVYGFSLLNTEDKVQPMIFTPVLGGENSEWKAGEVKRVSWRLLAWPGDWKGALEYASEKIMGVTDYRKPVRASLTDAALNMFDLIMDAKAGGWDAEFKGFYDIETASMSKQAAPLVLLSAAVLARNETFFRERTLPTIEHLLSRKSSAYISAGVNNKGAPVGGQMFVPSQTYGTAAWQGVDALLGRRNPWLEEFMLPGGQIAHFRSFNAVPRWSDLLAAHRHHPNPELLRQIRAEADAFIATQFHGRSREPVSFEGFYNISFYPYWWDLLELYDLTREPRYLAAAEEGGFHTIAGLWSHPMFPPGEIEIHPSSSEPTIHGIWWKDGAKYRLGWPRTPGDTPNHHVPAWQVSHIGLGLEQPSTYAGAGTTAMNNILLSSWAPHLLRLYAATGRRIYETYARNTIIGRFANYPGYYYHLFSDLMQDPRYPYRGPDVSNLYYHHIPVHLGFTLDYLVTQASLLSGGKVHFPFAVQQNYAWFSFHVYGMERGTVFGDPESVLWLQREIADIDHKDVDWLAARSPRKFHLMLMNQFEEAIPLPLRINAVLAGIAPGAAWAVYENGHEQPVREGKWPLDKLTIAGRGMMTVSITAESEDVFRDVPSLTQGHVQEAMGGKWGKLHAFRLRGPFGSDSVFAVFTGDPGKGAKVEFSLAGVTHLDERMPFEASVYPVKRDEDVRCRVRMTDSDGTVRTAEIALPR